MRISRRESNREDKIAEVSTFIKYLRTVRKITKWWIQETEGGSKINWKTNS